MKMTTRRSRRNTAEHLLAQRSGRVSLGSSPRTGAGSLTTSPLFAGMSTAEVERALTGFDEVRFPSGGRVVLEGLRGTDFFLLVDGRAAVLIDGWRVATLGPGDFFGEVAVLDDGLRTASVRAETHLRCLVLPNGKLQELILESPQVGVNLLRTMAVRLRGMTGRRLPPAAELAGA